MAPEPVRDRAHHVILARLTDIRCAMIQRFGPKFVVSQPVRADDAEAGELMMDTLDLVRSRCFQVQNQRISAMPRNRAAGFFVRTGQVNRVKMLGKADRQSLSSSGVIVIEHDAKCFHTSP